MNKATNTDPIFAAIERHRVAEREYGEVLTEQNKLEKELPVQLRQSHIRRPRRHDASSARVVIAVAKVGVAD
jgi:hypothetical protein